MYPLKVIIHGYFFENCSYFENMINIQACVAMTTAMIEMKYKLHLLHELI